MADMRNPSPKPDPLIVTTVEVKLTDGDLRTLERLHHECRGGWLGRKVWKAHVAQRPMPEPRKGAVVVGKRNGAKEAMTRRRGEVAHRWATTDDVICVTWERVLARYTDVRVVEA